MSLFIKGLLYSVHCSIIQVHMGLNGSPHSSPCPHSIPLFYGGRGLFFIDWWWNPNVNVLCTLRIVENICFVIFWHFIDPLYQIYYFLLSFTFRPGVAMLFYKHLRHCTDSLINSLTHSSFVEIFSEHLHSQTVRARELKFFSGWGSAIYNWIRFWNDSSAISVLLYLR